MRDKALPLTLPPALGESVDKWLHGKGIVADLGHGGREVSPHCRGEGAPGAPRGAIGKNHPHGWGDGKENLPWQRALPPAESPPRARKQNAIPLPYRSDRVSIP